VARRPRLDRELERYLVAGETTIVAVRRHWFHLFREILLLCGATALAIWVDVNAPRNSSGEAFQNLSLFVFWGAFGWLVWSALNWRHEWFVATDKRFLLFYGFIRRKVAMMPLLKVTDMTYDRSLLGRIVGYGTFVLESAGRDQALSRIDHVPDADTHYRAICTQLFGPNSQIRFAPGFVEPPPPVDDGPVDDGPDDGGGGNGGGRGTSGPDAGGPAPAGASPRRSPAEPSPLPTPVSRPESWYRSSNLRAPSHVGDTGEIPVVRVPREAEEPDDSRLYPPPHWVD
jgi:hypothetical protein